ncbi:MAG: GTPase Era, partial [Deltaproteobacteria bacterium]|nr:GTPase Era [Deltaproteobacteria bacterium]
GEKARGAIERLLERKVYLDLRVKVDEGWTDRDDKLKALGYNEME